MVTGWGGFSVMASVLAIQECVDLFRGVRLFRHQHGQGGERHRQAGGICAGVRPRFAAAIFISREVSDASSR